MLAEQIDDVGGVILADMHLQVLVKMFKEKSDVKKALEKELAKIKEEICMEIANDDTLVNNDGEVIATYKMSSPVTRFDKDKLATDLPHIYEKYVYKGDPVRTFLVK
jgi:2-hydroxy-3-keto-5-methylthiopentenyl-1-phosphate phosphatase